MVVVRLFCEDFANLIVSAAAVRHLAEYSVSLPARQAEALPSPVN